MQYVSVGCPQIVTIRYPYSVSIMIASLTLIHHCTYETLEAFQSSQVVYQSHMTKYINIAILNITGRI